MIIFAVLDTNWPTSELTIYSNCKLTPNAVSARREHSNYPTLLIIFFHLDNIQFNTIFRGKRIGMEWLCVFFGKIKSYGDDNEDCCNFLKNIKILTKCNLVQQYMLHASLRTEWLGAGQIKNAEN